MRYVQFIVFSKMGSFRRKRNKKENENKKQEKKLKIFLVISRVESMF